MAKCIVKWDDCYLVSQGGKYGDPENKSRVEWKKFKDVEKAKKRIQRVIKSRPYGETTELDFEIIMCGVGGIALPTESNKNTWVSLKLGRWLTIYNRDIGVGYDNLEDAHRNVMQDIIIAAHDAISEALDYVDQIYAE